MDEEGNQRAPHSQPQPLLHVTPGLPPHVPTSPVQHSPTMGGRQEMPLSPNSPPPTMGSSPRKSPPPNITVHDITGQPADSIAVVSAPSCHMVEEKPCHVKRRNGDPDGIAMGELWKLRPPPGGGGGGDSHIQVTVVVVFSPMGVNCRFSSHLRCFGRKVTIFAHSGIA